MKETKYLTIIIVIFVILTGISTFIRFQKAPASVPYPLVIQTEADTLGEQMFLAAAQLSYGKRFHRNMCWVPPKKALFFLPIRQCTSGDISAINIKPCYFPYYSGEIKRKPDCSALSGGKFQDERFFKSEKNNIKLNFTPPPPEQARDFIRRLKYENSVAVSVKRGDYIQKHLPILSIKYYERAIDYIAKKAGRGIKLYVFTDDPEWVKKHFPNRYPYEIISGNQDAVEISFMANCRHHILGNSANSWWGAYLSRQKNKIVVFPDEGNAENKVFSKNSKLKSWKSILEKPLPGGKIAIVYIATGRYISFWDNFYEKMEKYFITELPKEYFVFTDNTEKVFPVNVHRIYQVQEPWPYPTFNRFKYMNSIKDTLKKYDWIYFLNANSDPRRYMGGEIIPDKEQKLIFTQHPRYFDWKKEAKFPYARDFASMAYIPYDDGFTYILGGLNGGRSEDYLKMTAVLEKTVAKDIQTAGQPLWHDESHLNWYMLEQILIGNKLPLILSPIYSMFEEFMNNPDEFREMDPYRKNPYLVFIDKQKVGGRPWFRHIDKVNTTQPIPRTVSVIIPTYNNSKLLQKAIDSVIAQTFRDWELIVINNNSSDNTAEVLKKYEKNPQIRIVNYPRRTSMFGCLYDGMLRASGKYITIFRDDATNYPDRLERQIAMMTKEKLDFVAGRTDSSPPSKDILDSYDIGLNLLKDNIFDYSTVIIRKGFFVERDFFYDTGYDNAENYKLSLNFFIKRAKMGYTGGAPVASSPANQPSEEWMQTYHRSAFFARRNTLAAIIPNYRDDMQRLSLCELMPRIIKGNKTTKILDEKELKRYDKNHCKKNFLSRYFGL